MLLNGVYSKLLNERNSMSTVQAIADSTGEFLKLDNIIICEDIPKSQKYKLVYEWISKTSMGKKSGVDEFFYDDYPNLTEELDNYETYFSDNPAHNIFGLDFSSYIASYLNGDGQRFGMIVYVINNRDRILSHGDKRLLRSVSQIIAAVLMRCKDNERLEKYNIDLQRLAFRDQVLGVKNKTSLMDDVNLALKRNGTGSVVAFKMPEVKNIEAYIGLGSTDKLIKEILKKISQYERFGAEPYRFSDSVFVVVLRGIDIEGARVFCNDLISFFKTPWVLGDSEYTVNVTVGVAPYPAAGATAEEVCRVAIMSMNKAHDFAVDDKAVFSGEFEDSEAREYACARTLKKASEQDMTGLTVRYLPVYSKSKDGSYNDRIVSCEAAVSIEDADLSGLPSRIIMTTAEKMGLDIKLSAWVFKKSCEFCKRVRGESGSGDFTVCVNATSRSLTTGAVEIMVKDALEKTGLPPDGLAIQFSERIVAVNYDSFILVMKKLKKIGVQIVLDNIGSYYTATSLLRYSGINGAKADVTVFSGTMDKFSDVYLDNIIELAKNNNVSIGIKGLPIPLTEKEVLDITERSRHIKEIDFYQGGFRGDTMNEDEFVSTLSRQADCLQRD
jgi:predicted signal transduction protein with EAL and GGDEF domain